MNVKVDDRREDQKWHTSWWAAVYIIVACLMIWGWPWAKLKSPVHRMQRYRLIIKWCGCDQQTPSNLIIPIRNDKRLGCGTWWKNTDAQSGARVFSFFPLTSLKCSVALTNRMPGCSDLYVNMVNTFFSHFSCHTSPMTHKLTQGPEWWLVSIVLVTLPVSQLDPTFCYYNYLIWYGDCRHGQKQLVVWSRH